MTRLSKGDLIINTDAASSSGKDSFSSSELLKNLENYDPNKKVDIKSNTVIPMDTNPDGSIKYTFDNIYEKIELGNKLIVFLWEKNFYI
jgi:hypothetical protein